jgi:2-polyprenyl-6-methoxyphenol hydroxylase-like FAD-dependent oxidoreductase
VSKRLDFDNFLVEEVRQRRNVDLREGTTIKTYERIPRTAGASPPQPEQTFDCRILLLADGAHSTFSRHIAGHQKEAAHHAAAVRAYYRGIEGFHGDNFIELHFLPELNPGYSGFSRFPTDRPTLALECEATS